jgi:hypothetical protein
MVIGPEGYALVNYAAYAAITVPVMSCQVGNLFRISWRYASAKSVAQPDALADDLTREMVVCVAVGWCAIRRVWHTIWILNKLTRPCLLCEAS